jgi:hypothetical protein
VEKTSSIPSELNYRAKFKEQKGKGLHTLQVVLLKKICWLKLRKEVEQHKSATPAIRRLVLVFVKGSIEQTRRRTVFAGYNPSAPSLRISGEHPYGAPLQCHLLDRKG